MIIHPLFSFGKLNSPIPLLHVWSSYISVLTDVFSKFLPFYFPCHCYQSHQIVNMVIRGKEANPNEREEKGMVELYWIRSSFFSAFTLLVSIYKNIPKLTRYTLSFMWIINQVLFLASSLEENKILKYTLRCWLLQTHTSEKFYKYILVWPVSSLSQRSPYTWLNS